MDDTILKLKKQSKLAKEKENLLREKEEQLKKDKSHAKLLKGQVEEMELKER